MSEEAIHEEIGRRLAALRRAMGNESKAAWAERNGFNATQYHNWERGIRRIPVEAAERLCDRYGLTLDWLYRGRVDGLSENIRKAV